MSSTDDEPIDISRYLESEFFKIVIENPIDSGDGINHGLQTAPTSTSSTSPSPSASISSLPASSSTSSRSTSTSKSEQHEPQDPPTADAPPIPDAFEALAAELARVKVSPGSLGSYKPRIKTLKTLKTPKPAGASTGAEASSAAAPAMYVHRELLASLSPELERHTVSGMKEGGGMVMHGVDLPTLRRFLQWAYTQEYSIPKDIPEGASLFIHIKLFILASRYAVKRLMELAITRLTAELLGFEHTITTITITTTTAAATADASTTTTTTTTPLLDWIMGATVHAFHHLPTRPAPTAMLDHGTTPPPTLDAAAIGAHLIRFIAHNLSVFKRSPKFELFLDKDPHLAKSLLYLCANATAPPPPPSWSCGAAAPSSTSGVPALAASTSNLRYHPYGSPNSNPNIYTYSTPAAAAAGSSSSSSRSRSRWPAPYLPLQLPPQNLATLLRAAASTPSGAQSPAAAGGSTETETLLGYNVNLYSGDSETL